MRYNLLSIFKFKSYYLFATLRLVCSSSIYNVFNIFISGLAKTNRHPFDLPEAESELVAGMSFALFSLAEYSNILMMSSLFFFGG